MGVVEIRVRSTDSAAAILFDDDGRALILQRGSTAPWMPLSWNLPGGGIDAGEVIGFFYLHLSNHEVARTIGEVIVAIGKSGMAVAAITGLILDNLIPGSRKERGLVD